MSAPGPPYPAARPPAVGGEMRNTTAIGLVLLLLLVIGASVVQLVQASQ